MAKIPFEEMARNIVNLALLSSEHLLTTLTPSFNLSKVMREGMEELLPDDIHLLVRDRLHISMTKVWDRSNLAVNSFNSTPIHECKTYRRKTIRDSFCHKRDKDIWFFWDTEV